MSPLSAPVLGAASLVSAPATWSTFVEQTSPASVALSRFLVSVLLVWVAFELVALLVGPAPARAVPSALEDAPEVPGAEMAGAEMAGTEGGAVSGRAMSGGEGAAPAAVPASSVES